MTLESKENYPRHTKIVQNSLGFMPEVKPLHKPRGDLVLCARKAKCGFPSRVYTTIYGREAASLKSLSQL